MNLERRVRKLNVLLRTEIGENPPHSWIYSESEDFLHPMVQMSDDGSTTYDYKANPVTGLIVAAPKVVTRKIDVRCQNEWVMCIRKIPDPQEWASSFGTYVNYPPNGKWIPVDRTKIDASTGRVMAAGAIRVPEPDEDLTWEFIQMVRESRAFAASALGDQIDKNEITRDRRIRRNLRDEIREDFGPSTEPGKLRESSFPPTKLSITAH